MDNGFLFQLVIMMKVVSLFLSMPNIVCCSKYEHMQKTRPSACTLSFNIYITWNLN